MWCCAATCTSLPGYGDIPNDLVLIALRRLAHTNFAACGLPFIGERLKAAAVSEASCGCCRFLLLAAASELSPGETARLLPTAALPLGHRTGPARQSAVMSKLRRWGAASCLASAVAAPAVAAAAAVGVAASRCRTICQLVSSSPPFVKFMV